MAAKINRDRQSPVEPGRDAGKAKRKIKKWENGIEKVGLGSIQDATERVPSVPGMGLN